MNTLSFLHSVINQRLLLPVVFALLTTPVLAAGDNSTNSKTPDCPSGQVYDSTKKQCVPEKTSQLSDEDKTRYAYHLAKKGEYQAALDLLNTLKMAIPRKPGITGAMPRVSWAVPMRALATISVQSRSIRPMPKYVNTWVKHGWRKAVLTWQKNN